MPIIIPEPNAPVNIHIVLTDGEHVHDERDIHPNDLPQLNKIAQEESRGELWWEPQTALVARRFGIPVPPSADIPYTLLIDSMSPLQTLLLLLGTCLKDVRNDTAVSADNLQTCIGEVNRLAAVMKYLQGECLQRV